MTVGRKLGYAMYYKEVGRSLTPEHTGALYLDRPGSPDQFNGKAARGLPSPHAPQPDDRDAP
jgi:hypothetical protein